MRTLLLLGTLISFGAPEPLAPVSLSDPTFVADNKDGGKKKKKDEEKEEDLCYFLNRSAFSTTSAPAVTFTDTFLFTPS